MLTMSLYSGDQQQGVVGEFLDPLMVRVTDARGNGVVDVEVRWTVTPGAGRFEIASGITRTGTNGVSSIGFQPLVSGLTSVAAEANVLVGSPAIFMITATAPPFVLIRFGPLFDCVEPSLFFPEVTQARVGALVHWQYAKWPGFDCSAQLRSTAVPPGGTAFSSGIIRPGERFAFTPNVTGDWVYEDAMNGGKGILRVR